MAHETLRIISKLSNTPHLISANEFETIVNILENRQHLFKLSDDIDDDNEDREDDDDLEYENGVGFLKIQGPLTYKSTPFQMLCGGMSYEKLLYDMSCLMEVGCKVVVMETDSGGGEAYSMFETASMLRKMADENGCKLIAYVDGDSASAAYGLNSVAHEIVANPSAEVGSVGVVIRLMNDSKALEKEGIERSFVYAGDSKIPFDEKGEFRKEFIDDLQYKVDALYEDFTEFVAENREISVKAVKDTKAKTFLSRDAIKIGLIDKIMTKEDFYSNYLPSVLEGMEKEKTHMSWSFGKPKQTKEVQMSEIEDIKSQLSSVMAEKQEMMKDFETKFAAIVAEKAALESAIADMKKKQLEDKNAARKAALSEVVSDEKLEATFESLSVLDDASFSTVLSTLKANYVAESQSALFTEAGASGESDLSDIVPAEEESAEMKLIKQTYHK